MDPFGDSSLRQMAAEMQEKKTYITQYIVDYGYDESNFNEYMAYAREGGDNLENWTLDELSGCIRDYYAYCDPNYNDGDQGGNDLSKNPSVLTRDHQQMPDIAEMNNAMDRADGSQPADSFAQPQTVDTGKSDVLDEAEFEDLKAKNRPQSRLFAPTASIDPTPLNNKRIQARVLEGTVKAGGLFQSSYLQYTVRIDPLGWNIVRKDQDFYFLRKMLLKYYPYIIVPPLPIKKKKESDKSIRRREKYLTRFMQGIMRCEELKGSSFLIDWLRTDDAKEFQKITKLHEKIKFQKGMEHVQSLQGRVPGQMISNSAVFCSKMTDFIDSYQILYNEVIECAKDINEKSKALASTMFAMHKFIEQLSELNRMTRCQDQHEMYAWLSKMITGSGNFIAQQGELFKGFLGSHMKYHLIEHESFREILKNRDEIKNAFIKQEKSLLDRKERLLRQKDLTKWGYTGEGGTKELDQKLDKLVNHKEAAFTYMLQNETRDMELRREQLSFYTNQCLEETRRIGRDDGKLLIDHFIQMSQSQCSYINQAHVMWADFLSHFQEEADNAALYEAEVGEDTPIQEKQPSVEEKKDADEHAEHGGSGGTPPVQDGEDPKKGNEILKPSTKQETQKRKSMLRRASKK